MSRADYNKVKQETLDYFEERIVELNVKRIRLVHEIDLLEDQMDEAEELEQAAQVVSLERQYNIVIRDVHDLDSEIDESYMEIERLKAETYEDAKADYDYDQMGTENQ